MANYGTPPVQNFKVVPSDIYEVVTAPFALGISDAEDKPAGEIVNTFYDDAIDPPSKATQLQWSLIIRESGEFENIPLRVYTGSSIGRHPRNKLTNLVKLLDSSFSIDKAYANKEDFLQKNALRPLRVVVESITKGEGTEAKTFPKVTGFLPSKLGELTELEKLTLSSTMVRTQDPFAA